MIKRYAEKYPAFEYDSPGNRILRITFNKPETNFRKFCKTCGGHVICDLPGFNFVEVYPNTLPDFVHEPTIHVHYGSKTISVHDGLLIFKGLPTDFGGFGEMLPD